LSKAKPIDIGDRLKELTTNIGAPIHGFRPILRPTLIEKLIQRSAVPDSTDDETAVLHADVDFCACAEAILR